MNLFYGRDLCGGHIVSALALVAGALLMAGCAEQPGLPVTAPPKTDRAFVAVVDVDNGSDDALVIEVDGKIVATNGPRQIAQLKLNPGKHEFVARRGTQEVDRIQADTLAGKATVINPMGLSSYYVFTDAYSASPAAGYGAGMAPDRVHSQKVVQADFGLFEATPVTIQVRSSTPFGAFQNATRTKAAKMVPVTLKVIDALAVLLAEPNVYDATDSDYNRAAAVLAAQPQGDAICAALLKAVTQNRGGKAVFDALEKYKAAIPPETYEAWLTGSIRGNSMAATCGARLLIACGRMDVVEKCFDKCPDEQAQNILNSARGVKESAARKTLVIKALGRHSEVLDRVVMSIVQDRDFKLDTELAVVLEEYIKALPDSSDKYSHKSNMTTMLAREICRNSKEFNPEWLKSRLVSYAGSSENDWLVREAVRLMTEMDMGQALAPIFGTLEESIRQFAVTHTSDECGKRGKFTSGANAVFVVATADKSADVRVVTARTLAMLYKRIPNSMVISLLEKSVMKEADQNTRDQLQRWLTYASR